MGKVDKIIKISVFVLALDLLIRPMAKGNFDNYLTGHAVANIALAYDPLIAMVEFMLLALGLCYIFIGIWFKEY